MGCNMLSNCDCFDTKGMRRKPRVPTGLNILGNSDRSIMHHVGRSRGLCVPTGLNILIADTGIGAFE